ncbi:SPFH domain-containing protein [Paenibacillus hexagrammi]|uniref:SPFH domain-containing protein n=1 Tax=Paenibacillus hexagrammi TaxID=2908839 RepID=A0ABY3SE72_9BACL|nr:SPFH domain-containing protein [Paenibacillus sp. YPD9-1]UJF32288.1 SPFH domain-containing protein [Paenibacillus sp. YPD9-1]
MNETKAWSVNGFIGIILSLLGIGLGVLLLIQEWFVTGMIVVIIGILFSSTITIIQPNEASVITFFGKYAGTIRKSGLWLVIPFSTRKKISLRVRNFNSVKLKVNDVDGNPIEIAAVVVFRVVDTYKALFEVDNYHKFVEIQSETALRHVATKYPYDRYEGEGSSLRGNASEVAEELSQELQERLSVAGVEIMEARLTHLAYSTEIASAMLQRQQASAILSARQKIVEGAVGMVQMAISQLEADGLQLDEEKKAAMINNLLVAIVSDRSANPVINTGTLY